jgi:hypothetical protein
LQSKDNSKGKKPKVAKKEKDQNVAELVLSLGVEGGGFSIYRSPLAGGWQFHEEGGSMMILDDDDGGMEEVWSHSTSKPVQTIQEMLPLKEEYDSWVMFCPISIHPDYRFDIWELVQEIVRNLPDEKKRWWADRRRKRWERFLRRKVSLEPLPKPEDKTKPAKTPKAKMKPKKAPDLFSLFGPEAEDVK